MAATPGPVAWLSSLGDELSESGNDFDDLHQTGRTQGGGAAGRTPPRSALLRFHLAASSMSSSLAAARQACQAVWPRSHWRKTGVIEPAGSSCQEGPGNFGGLANDHYAAGQPHFQSSLLGSLWTTRLRSPGTGPSVHLTCSATRAARSATLAIATAETAELRKMSIHAGFQPIATAERTADTAESRGSNRPPAYARVRRLRARFSSGATRCESTARRKARHRPHSGAVVALWITQSPESARIEDRTR